MIEKIIRYQLDTEENNLAILIFKNTNSTPEPFKFDSAWYRKKVSICGRGAGGGGGWDCYCNAASALPILIWCIFLGTVLRDFIELTSVCQYMFKETVTSWLTRYLLMFVL